MNIRPTDGLSKEGLLEALKMEFAPSEAGHNVTPPKQDSRDAESWEESEVSENELTQIAQEVHDRTNRNPRMVERVTGAHIDINYVPWLQAGPYRLSASHGVTSSMRAAPASGSVPGQTLHFIFI